MSRTYRFFVRNTSVASTIAQEQSSFRLTENQEPEIFFQVKNVLRCKQGDILVLITSQENPPYLEFHFTVENVTKNEINCRFQSALKNTNELPYRLGLVLALPNRPEKLGFIIQKAVEIGVSSITLCEADFSQFRHHIKPERLEKIILEAAEQSERPIIPKLFIEGKLSEYLIKATKGETGPAIWVAMERYHRDPEKKPTGNPFVGADTSRGLDILIGPEGGFSESEKNIMQKRGLSCFSLGKRILRMETAAVLSLGLASLLG